MLLVKFLGLLAGKIWGLPLGSRRDFMVGCPRAAAVSGCEVMVDRWVVPHLRDSGGCSFVAGLLVTLFLTSGRGSKAAEVQRVWDIYDDRLQFMSWNDALSLDGALDCGDVSLAWMIWSSAIEAALADAYRFAGGPVPDRGLVLGSGVFRPRTVRLGGPKVREGSEEFC